MDHGLPGSTRPDGCPQFTWEVDCAAVKLSLVCTFLRYFMLPAAVRGGLCRLPAGSPTSDGGCVIHD